MIRDHQAREASSGRLNEGKGDETDIVSQYLFLILNHLMSGSLIILVPRSTHVSLSQHSSMGWAMLLNHDLIYPDISLLSRSLLSQGLCSR